MSWVDKILPSGVRRVDSDERRVLYPKGFGRNALSVKRYFIVPN